jgi:hypothetical protein
MRTSAAAAILLAISACTTAAPGAPKQLRHTDAPSTALQLFYDALSPYGQWWADPHLGWVWTPDVAVGAWQPYAEGKWVKTKAGLTFDAEVPWGWAVYHYGRWIDSDWGYSWVPGAVWSPGWTSWKNDDDQVGWAALNPDGTSDGLPWIWKPEHEMAAIASHTVKLEVTNAPRHLKDTVVAVKPKEIDSAAIGDLLGKRAALDPADEASPPVRRIVRGGRQPRPEGSSPGVSTASGRDEGAGTPHG